LLQPGQGKFSSRPKNNADVHLCSGVPLVTRN
jgi:hypothetical protein